MPAVSQCYDEIPGSNTHELKSELTKAEKEEVQKYLKKEKLHVYSQDLVHIVKATEELTWIDVGKGLLCFAQKESTYDYYFVLLHTSPNLTTKKPWKFLIELTFIPHTTDIEKFLCIREGEKDILGIVFLTAIDAEKWKKMFEEKQQKRQPKKTGLFKINFDREPAKKLTSQNDASLPRTNTNRTPMPTNSIPQYMKSKETEVNRPPFVGPFQNPWERTKLDCDVKVKTNKVTIRELPKPPPEWNQMDFKELNEPPPPPPKRITSVLYASPTDFMPPPQPPVRKASEIVSKEHMGSKKSNSSSEENASTQYEFPPVVQPSSQLESASQNLSKKFKFPSKISINNDKIGAIGIDLGTSRCCAAVNRRSGIEIVALDNKGERQLPSYVSYNEIHDKCGQIVVNMLRDHEKSIVFDAKRIIGREVGEIEIDSIWPFPITNLNNQTQIQVLKCNKESWINPEEVSASLLKFIKEKCEKFQGKSLSKVVITIPAVFTEPQKDATILAAKLAGFEVVHLLPEPIAASFAYFIDRPIPNHSFILLFDLGGGTLDVCISKIENDEIIIISQNGDSQLGGRDFDKVLINYLKNLLISDFGISIDKNKYKFMLECQNLKETLSAVETASLHLDEFDQTKDGVVEMRRTAFEKMTFPLLTRIKNTINAALFDAKLDPSQINKVLQVGGGSRMPMIKNLLEEIFPNSEHCCETNPDEVVAVGAAYYAYNCFSS